MRGARSFGRKQMTKRDNALAFKAWLVGCTTPALEVASPESIARSYGVPLADVSEAIEQERLRRRMRA